MPPRAYGVACKAGLALCLLLLALPAFSADYQSVVSPLTGRVQTLRRSTAPVRGKGGALMAKPVVEQAAQAFVVREQGALGVTEPAEWSIASVAPDELGYQHVRFFQTHAGLQVYGAELYLHLDAAGEVYLAGAKTVADFPAQAMPVLTAEVASALAVRASSEEAPGMTLTSAGAPRLLWLPLGIVRNSTAQTRLAWEVRVTDGSDEGEGYSTRQYVDARTGEVVLGVSDIERLNRKVYDCAVSPQSGANCYMDFQDPFYPDYYHGRSEGQPARGPHPNPDVTCCYGSTDVDSLHSFFGQVHAYVGEVLGLNDGANSWGGTGIFPNRPVDETRGFMHVVTGFNCPNAAFQGNTGSMVFCAKTVLLDVVGHEYGHAVAWHCFEDGSNSGFSIGYVYAGHRQLR